MTTGHEGSQNGLPSRFADDIESTAKRISLTVKLLNPLNTQELSELRRDLTQGDLVRKCGAASDLKCSAKRTFMIIRIDSIAREIGNCEEERKRGAQFDNDDERQAEWLRASLVGRVCKLTLDQ